MGNDTESANHTLTLTASRNTPGIWPALLIALGLHGLILSLPLSRQTADNSPISALIELQLTRFEPLPLAEDPVAEDIFPTGPAPPSPAAALPSPLIQDKSAPEMPALTQKAEPTSPKTSFVPIERDIEHMNTEEKGRLTHTILSSQFITEESATDQLFGKPVAHHSTETRKEFHYPERTSLVAMLDQPMQELPFEYTPGLVHFAYDPGVKGDLQRFWDVITPEFGWITNYGTEVKCKWVLVIAACGWK